jgi:glycosyltransferase involved in cell wall biosynthesis
MKLAIIGSRGYPYVYSGYETFVRELSERLVKKGVEVHVYCHKNLFHSYPPIVKGIYLHYIPTIETKSLSQLIHSTLCMLHTLGKGYDALLVVNAANGPLGIIPRLAGTKTLINVDGMEWLRPKWKGWGARYFYFAAKMATRLYDLVITDADAMRAVYLKEFNKDSKVIAYGAPDISRQSFSLNPAWGLESGEYYLIVGRLIPDNNADLIIDGFIRAHSGKKLVVVGDVPYQDEWAEKLKSIQHPNLLFLGYITKAGELMSLYQHCFVYLHGHEFGGTNPTMLKAMACQCAILALDTSFNREMLQDGTFGVFFDKLPAAVAQQMINLEEKPERVNELKVNVSKALTEKYNWDAVTESYLDAIRSLTHKY